MIAICSLVGCAAREWTPMQRSEILDSINREGDKVRFLDAHEFGKDLKVERYELTNRLQVLILRDPKVPLYAYHTWFRVGSRNERPGITGIAHLFEHLMFAATETYGEGHYPDTIEIAGGQLNAATSRDSTYYYQNMPTGTLDLVASLESTRMRRIKLDSDQVQREQGVVVNERLWRYENNIDGLLYEQLYLNAFTKHSYHWPIIGYKKDITAITPDDCIKFYNTYYAPNNAVIVLAGDVDPAEALRVITERYGKIPASKIPDAKIAAEPKQKREIRKIISPKEHKQSIPADKMLLAFHIPQIGHEDLPVLEILNGILVDGMSSRLYKKLVDEERIASSISGHVDNHIDPGLFIMSVTLRDRRKAEEAEKIIYGEIERLKKSLVEQRELEKTKNNVEAFFVRLLKTNQYKAWVLGFYQSVVGDYRQLFDEVARYRSVTEKQIQEVARTYLNPTNRVVVIARAK